MNKKIIKHFIKLIRPISIWIFLVIAIVSGLIAVKALRDNNLRAIQLRDNVIQVDKDNGDIELALRKLREHVYAHMNTDLSSGPNAIKPPIQLKYRYERLVQAEQERMSVENSKIYSEAQAECEAKFPKGLSGSGRIPCITEYVSSRGVVQKEIPAALYKFDFVSPVWSPDLAGWSLVVCSVSSALFVIRFVLDRWLKAELRDLS